MSLSWLKAVRSSMAAWNWSTPTRFTSTSKMERLFRDTRGRWLYNERQQNDIRYTRFDPKELARVACQATDARYCTRFTKFDQGSHNKTFRLTLDNSLTVIARLPCPVAGPSYLVTASEVATLEFAREVLKLPVPRVITWSGEKRGHLNPVGADYIIMEEVPGVKLDERWMKFDCADDVAPVLTGIVDAEARFESLRFSRIGSLYFKEDVSAELDDVPLFSGAVDATTCRLSEKYCVGPLINNQWWRGERAHMALDRGPWPDAASFFIAAAQNEQSVLDQHFPSSSLYRRKPTHDRGTHSNLLSTYIRTIPHILPNDSDACAPTLWHPGFNRHNLIVSATGPGNLLGITGWQHAAILPYFSFASIPPALVYHGNKINMEGPLPGPLPANLEELSLDEQAEYRLDLRLANRHKWYEAQAQLNNRRLAVCSLPHIYQLMMLPTYVVRSWSDGVFNLRQALVWLRHNWVAIAGSDTPCPIDFSEEEMAEHERQWESSQCLEQVVELIYEAFQCEEDGLVGHENYDFVRKAIGMLEETWDEEITGAPFPLKDGEYSYFLS